MTFIDRFDTTGSDPSQPLTLNTPQIAQNLPQPYPRAPQPQSFVPPSTFIRNMPNRDPQSWGTEHWPITASAQYPGPDSGPDMPSPAEAYSTLARAGSQLQRWGSDPISERGARVNQLAMGFAPLLDMLSKGAFTRNFNRSSLAAIKRQQEQLIYEGEQLQQEHSKQLTDYGGIFAKADALAKQNPGQAGRIYEDARQELYEAAIQHQDGSLQSLLDNRGGIEAARQFIKQQDATFRDAWAATTSLKKATGGNEDAQTADEWGEQANAAMTQHHSVFDPPTAAGGPAEPGPQGVETPTADNLARIMNLTPQEMQAVREQVATGKSSAGVDALAKGKETGLDNLIRRKVGRGVDAMNQAIDRIAGNDRLTPEQKLAEIGKYSPNVAAQISGLNNYELNPKEEGVVSRQRLAGLTKQIFKDYNQANFENANRFYSTNSVENKVITRANDLVQNWMTLLKALKPIGENKSIPREQIEAWLAGHGTGDPEYDQVYSQIRNIVTQINSIQTLTGTPRVTLVHDMVANLAKDSSPRSIRAQLLPDVQDAYAIINSYQDQWEGFGKRNLMPGIAPGVFRDYRAIIRMNPYTGQVPEDSSQELKAAGQDPGRASTRLTPAQKEPPLTLEKIRNLKGKISQFEHDPDPDKRQQAQEARELIGPVRNIDRFIPGVDEPPNAARP